MIFFAFFCVLLLIASASDNSYYYDDVENNNGEVIQGEGEFSSDSKRRWLPPFVDSVREDDHGDFDLADIMAIVDGSVDLEIDQFTDEQRQQHVDFHNDYRANTSNIIFPAASNMEYMHTYDEILEFNAREYLRKCVFAHGLAENDKYEAQGLLQGQNLYIGYSRHVGWPIWKFYSERYWYHFNNHTCMQPYPKYKCGHVTLMMWHNLTRVGGAIRSYCFPKDNLLIVNHHFLPNGNIVEDGYVLYKYGWHCTRCPAGMLCHRDTCIPKEKCQELGLDCECKLECRNCAQPDWKNCRCPCKTGWAWADCSYPCGNEMDTCPKLSVKNCKKFRTFPYVCPHRCGRCKIMSDKDANKTDVCCGGVICEKFFVLDEETCECKPMCPSPLCLFPSSTKRPELLTGKGNGARTGNGEAVPGNEARTGDGEAVPGNGSRTGDGEAVPGNGARTGDGEAGPGNETRTGDGEAGPGNKTANYSSKLFNERSLLVLCIATFLTVKLASIVSL